MHSANFLRAGARVYETQFFGPRQSAASGGGNAEGYDRHRPLQGADPAPSTPEQLGRYMLEEQARWRKVIKSANLKLE